jgi:hypothetical protein
MLPTKFQSIWPSGFRNRPTRKNNCLWQPCLYTDRDEICNLYRAPSIYCFLPSFGSFGKAVLEKNLFRNRLIRNKNCLYMLWPCLLMDRNEMALCGSGVLRIGPQHPLACRRSQTK